MNSHKAIMVVMHMMFNDYQSQYKKICADEKAATAYRDRLFKKIGEFHYSDILEGYDMAIEDSPKFLPTIPDLFAHIKTLGKKRSQAVRNQKENEKLSALPAPTHNVDATKVLSEAKEKAKNNPSDDGSRLARLAELKQNHDAVLSLHGRNITKIALTGMQSCRYDGCHKAGSISGQSGEGVNYYCAEHFRMT